MECLYIVYEFDYIIETLFPVCWSIMEVIMDYELYGLKKTVIVNNCTKIKIGVLEIIFINTLCIVDV